ncbi:MAG TPA: IclR family transcriptional regulator [Candidatus Limnocylindrales bacterium]|nr:IclR family transcriptional regulator [Candidatus Limnocylindrales bacterium]
MSRVQSIERAFAVLSALSDGPIGVTEVAERTELAKSTAARLLASLAREGAVEQVPGQTRYRLGPRMATLSAGVAPVRNLVAIARPILEALARETGEAAGLSVPDGATVHYIDQVDSTHEVQVRDWTGTRVPMHAVSSGQVFLAHMNPTEVERYLAQPRVSFTPKTITDSSALRDRLRQVQLDGFAWVREEFAEGLNSVAAPVADDGGEIVAAVHLHGPSYRFPALGETTQINELVVEAAGRLSKRLRRAD